MNLQIININTVDGQEVYKQAIDKIQKNHPYYTLDFIKTFSLGLRGAHAFVYEVQECGKLIVMPFYLRKINRESSSNSFYFDIASTYGYSGPLYDSTINSEILNKFWAEVDTWYRNNSVVSEFIRFNLSDNHIGYTGTCLPTLKNIKGEIQEIDTIWKNYEHKVRKNVKRAIANQLEVKIYHNKIPSPIVSVFYDIYLKTMDRLETKKRFYFGLEKICNYIKQNEEQCAIAITYLNDQPVSCELMLLSKTEIFSFLGGTLSKYFKLRPNDLLKHEVIKWALENNFKYYVLGGGYGKEDGIFRYKKSFFPNDISIYYTGRKIVDREAYNNLSLLKSQIDPEYEIDSSFFPAYRKE